ncbi:XrtA/PEP-CTERM system histidine kinase PrsK [Undibacterium sp. SXout20W]|uniref:XrtA/PEP-CTERM system histidine kinase PrsK n=1 Tax=Undibacterium sp. SXout20W TaxID=3413051 RepID=UPI003BF3529D
MHNSISIYSYGSASLGYLALAVTLALKWKNQWQWGMFFASAIISSLWAATFVILFGLGLNVAPIAQCLEVLRSACWIIFLMMLMRPAMNAAGKRLLNTRPFIIGILTYLLLLLVGTIFINSRLLSGLVGVVAISGRAVLAVIGMLLVEQLFRSSSEHDRWSMKFACMALAGLFVYDFYLYSDAMLFHAINPEILAARGFINALLIPLFIVSLNRNLEWTTGIAVSRRILFHSAALIGSSVYLLVMAAAGYYLRYFGGQWGGVLQMAFLCGAFILLFTVLFSGSMRSKLRVFISKHFYQYSYDYREEWICFTRVLSAEGPGLGERTIAAVAQLVESGAGTLFINRQVNEFKVIAQWNTNASCQTVSNDSELCRFMREKQWIIDLKEYRRDPGNYDDIEIDSWLINSTSAWLLIPLIFQGRLLGFILLEQSRSKIELNWEILDVLKIAANQAASYLAQQESADALMIARQFESFNRMSTFIVHDLKNMVAQLSLMMVNAEKHKNNPEFQQDMLQTIDHSIQKMKTLLQKLARGFEADYVSPLKLDELLRRVIETKSPYEPKPILEVTKPDIVAYANRERMERVIGHLIQNAIDATPREGVIKVELDHKNQAVEIRIIDNGAGMSEEFINEKLFSPFVSTKVAGMGIGVFETREYVQQLGGRLEVISQPKAGTCFTIILPDNNNQDFAIANLA